jgi:DNA modification methylase
MQLQLPEGSCEGCLLAITWPESEIDKVVSGTFEGRLLKINGDQIVVKFEYEPDYFIQQEQIAIDLRSGLDFKYHAKVTGIELIGPRASS